MRKFIINMAFTIYLTLNHSFHCFQRIIIQRIFCTNNYSCLWPFQGKSFVTFLSSNELLSQKNWTCQRIYLVLFYSTKILFETKQKHSWVKQRIRKRIYFRRGKSFLKIVCRICSKNGMRKGKLLLHDKSSSGK